MPQTWTWLFVSLNAKPRPNKNAQILRSMALEKLRHKDICIARKAIRLHTLGVWGSGFRV